MKHIAKITALFILFIHQILATEEQLNPYQIIYDAFTESKTLSDEEIKNVREKFTAQIPSNNEENSELKTKRLYTKSFLWALSSDNYNNAFFKNTIDCLYDDNSKEQRALWRSKITSNITNKLFLSLLEIDIAQDLEMPEEVLSKLHNLCCSFSTPLERRSILNDWRLSIEEENKLTQEEETEKKFLNLTENTLLEAYQKKYILLGFSDRLKTILIPLSTLLTAIFSYVIYNAFTPFGEFITNSYNISLNNISLSSLNNMFLHNLTTTQSFQDANQTLYNITATTFDKKEASPLNTTVLPLAALTLTSTVILFAINIEAFFHQLCYFYYYCSGKNLEQYPKSMVQTLYEHSKQITDEEKRKIYIKTMSDFIVDTFSKCWRYDSAINSCTTKMITKLEELKNLGESNEN